MSDRIFLKCADCIGYICYHDRNRILYDARDTCTCTPGSETPKSRFEVGEFVEMKNAGGVVVKIEEVWFAYTDQFRFWYHVSINSVPVNIAECDLDEVEIISVLGKRAERE